MQKMKNISYSRWLIRFVSLVVLFTVFFSVGALAVSGLIPELVPEPGLVSVAVGIMIIAVANTLLTMWLVLSSRWNGWKLALWLAFAYYGAVTFMMQIETWYFLTGLTVDGELLPGLFIMGLPVAMLYIPLAVWILGKGTSRTDYFFNNPTPIRTIEQWLWKLAIIAVAYIVLYWLAGYFIAWQNPVLREFYGSPGAALPFWTHTINSLQTEYGLFLFQGLRGILWSLIAYPVIRGSKMAPFWTAVLVGLFLSVPQNIIHIIENPLMPIAGVRLSHMIETVSANFIFGLIVTWLLYREHRSLRNLFGIY